MLPVITDNTHLDTNQTEIKMLCMRTQSTKMNSSYLDISFPQLQLLQNPNVRQCVCVRESRVCMRERERERAECVCVRESERAECVCVKESKRELSMSA